MIAVLMPITSPARSTSGPPEFPGLIAASVCRNLWNCWPIPPRSFALMIPAVTVACNPKGLPIASTQSPTCTPSEFPSLAMGSSLFASILITARSVSSSTPTTLAVYLVVSPFSCTWIFVACSTTWLLVKMYPRLSTITPEPRLRSACGGVFCRPSKNRSKKSCIGSS